MSGKCMCVHVGVCIVCAHVCGWTYVESKCSVCVGVCVCMDGVCCKACVCMEGVCCKEVVMSGRV